MHSEYILIAAVSEVELLVCYGDRQAFRSRPILSMSHRKLPFRPSNPANLAANKMMQAAHTWTTAKEHRLLVLSPT